MMSKRVIDEIAELPAGTEVTGDLEWMMESAAYEIFKFYPVSSDTSRSHMYYIIIWVEDVLWSRFDSPKLTVQLKCEVDLRNDPGVILERYNTANRRLQNVIDILETYLKGLQVEEK